MHKKSPGSLIKVALPATILLLIFTAAASASAGAVSPAVVSIAASNSTSVALMDDGTVWQWGFNHGNFDWTKPTKIQISGVKQISAGDDHVLALKSDGTIWAWGSNTHGELGDGTYQDSLDPVEVQNMSGITAIAAGKDHSLALKSDGTVWAWGYNSYGQLGSGSKNDMGSPTPLEVNGLSDIKAIYSSGSHCFAIQNNGTVWAWGENLHGVLGDGTNESRYIPVKSKITGVNSIDAGAGWHVLAVKSDNNVWSWGYNFRGQLGTGGVSQSDQGMPSYGNSADTYNPDIVRGISDVNAVAAGGAFSVALKKDGTVWVWGYNGDGQLGLGNVGGNDVTTPTQVPGLNGVTAIAAGAYHTLALKSDGTVWAWGSNADGQIGNNSVSSTDSPVLVLMSTQIPQPVSPTPIAATTSTTTPTPGPTQAAGGLNLTLIVAIVVLVAILVVVPVAYMLVFRKK